MDNRFAIDKNMGGFVMSEIVKKVFDNVDQDKTVRTLQELVRIPAWVDFTKPTTEWEMKRAEYLKTKMKEIGVEVIVAGEVQYGRPTLIGFLRGQERGNPKLCFDGHIDTHGPIDPELMPRPFDGQIEDGEVKGLGTADQLPTMAACLNAVDAIRRSNVKLKRDFMIIFPSDEMIGARGIEVAVRWMKENKVVPEFGIAGECTDNNIGVSHTGIIEFEIEVIGMTGHPSQFLKETRRKVANPVVRMFDVGRTLLEIDKKEERFKIEHPYVGTSYTWVGSIDGGSRYPGFGWSVATFDPLEPGMTSYEAFTRHLSVAHVLPEYCKLRFGVRCIPKTLKPGEILTVEPEDGFHVQEVQDMVAKHLEELWRRDPSDCTYKLRLTQDRAIPYEISAEEPHVKKFAKVIERVRGKAPRYLGTKHWNETSRVTQQIGTPFVQVAPTWVRYHQPDEGCPIPDLMETTRIYTAAILDFCGTA
jgi:acetylornithine deacetylase/succinyl-diaminopimelate desuccinylase-like protein